MRTLGTRLGHCLEMMVSSLRHTTSSFSVVDLKGNVFEDVIETSIFIFLPTLTNYTFKALKELIPNLAIYLTMYSATMFLLV